MPNFIIVGVQRGGTTSLYEYLIQHPYVAPAFKKEIHFFDNNFRKGVFWYRAHFPFLLCKYSFNQRRKIDLVTGEATPYYFSHPHAPYRIFKVVPRVKIIILLRNPVDRAYSQYHHERKIGVETLSFEEAIEKEKQRLQGEAEKMLEDENYYSFNHQHYSYLSRGIYVDQIKVWMNLFSREQILILKSEDLYNDPPTIYNKVIKFLNLSPWELKEYRKYNVGHYQQMDVAVRKRLIDYFEPHNQKLYEYLGVNFGWDI